MQEEKKSAAVRLWVAAVLLALAGLSQAGLFWYAKSHFAEILRSGSAELFGGLVSVTETDALPNPHLTAACFCFVFAAACVFLARKWGRSAKQTSGNS